MLISGLGQVTHENGKFVVEWSMREIVAIIRGIPMHVIIRIDELHNARLAKFGRLSASGRAKITSVALLRVRLYEMGKASRR